MKTQAGVIEIANRVRTNETDEGISGIVDDLDNHQSSLNNNAHQISNIAGLQSALNSKEPAFSKNNAFNKNFGNTAGTVCEGNDNRLSNARTPTAHTHNISDIDGLVSALNGKADKSSFSGSLVVVTSVDFSTSTVTTAEINIVDGIITEIN